MKLVNFTYSISIVLLMLITASCSFFQSEESKIKNIIEAEIQSNANDPSSYSFVDMDIEKVTYNDLIQPTIDSNRNKFQTEHYLEFQNENLDKLNKIAYYRVNFSHREKNRMGGLELFKNIYDLKHDENNNLTIIWSVDKEDYEMIRSQAVQGNISFSIYENIANGNGRITALQVLEEMGLERTGWSGF